jgi:quinol monooxygenase YgiN
MAKWVHDANCFVGRYTVDPNRREEFLAAVNDLLNFAAPWYEEGCNFAFQGWGRNPNQWVAIACWKTEEILARLRETPEFRDCTVRMLECCTEPMTMEQFSGMNKDRSVFDLYPRGSSQVHLPTRDLEVIFL